MGGGIDPATRASNRRLSFHRGWDFKDERLNDPTLCVWRLRLGIMRGLSSRSLRYAKDDRVIIAILTRAKGERVVVEILTLREG
jgi:hypothetical protein